MTALSAPTPGQPEPDPEAMGRRSLGLDAVFCTAVGSVAVVAGGPVGRAICLPPATVRLAGLAMLGWAGCVGTWSVAEDWQSPTRRVLGANVVAAALLVGHAVVRGTPRGRVGMGCLAIGVAGFAGVQLKALLTAQPRPGS